MCGVIAAFNFQQLLSFDELYAATSLINHRGPDNMGSQVIDDVFLGHVRLAIVDPQALADQPFKFNNLSLIFNGEIYNYQELQQELILLGYEFTTSSDTEVVIKAFAEWGRDCFAKFNGMWAIVIYDAITKELVVSRDRFGQKPLFIYKSASTYVIASELQQLAALFPLQPNYKVIQNFLKEGGFDDKGQTFFAGVEIVPKAHSLVISTAGIDIYRYWDYPLLQNDSVDINGFHDLLHDAVRLRMRSDVPISLLLSGGVDSTIISGEVASLMANKVQLDSFTYSSLDANDETKYAQHIAAELGFKFHTACQDKDAQLYIKRLSDLVRNLGRGHSSPAIVSVDYLYENINKLNYKVALDGQGADELLAGYKSFHIDLILELIGKRLFKQAYHVMQDLLKTGFVSSAIIYVRNKCGAIVKSIGRYFYGYESLFARSNYQSGAKVIPYINFQPKQYGRLNSYLLQQHELGLTNLLYYGDIVAMKNSVENRSPFMDYRLVEYAFSSGIQLKVWNGKEKYVLRQHNIYNQFKSVLDRTKVGFSSTINPDTKLVMVNELQTSTILDWDIFSAKIKKFLCSDKAMSAKFERLIFRLYQVHLWNNIFIKSAEFKCKL